MRRSSPPRPAAPSKALCRAARQLCSCSAVSIVAVSPTSAALVRGRAHMRPSLAAHIVHGVEHEQVFHVGEALNGRRVEVDSADTVGRGFARVAAARLVDPLEGALRSPPQDAAGSRRATRSRTSPPGSGSRRARPRSGNRDGSQRRQPCDLGARGSRWPQPSPAGCNTIPVSRLMATTSSSMTSAITLGLSSSTAQVPDRDVIHAGGLPLSRCPAMLHRSTTSILVHGANRLV